MTDAEWETLRSALLQRFEEDVVQQALLELLEEQAKGVTVLNPLHWCLMRGKSRRTNEVKHAVREREVKETLAAFKVPYNTRSARDDARARKRRQRRREAA